MSLFRAPRVFTRIATALERIASAMEQMLRDADGQFDEERVLRVVDDRLSELRRREAKTREGYANMGRITGDEIRRDLGIRASAGTAGSHRHARHVGWLFGLCFRGVGVSR